MSNLSDVIGHLPYRMALAGGWIDQPFVNGVNPDPVGSMVTIGLRPTTRYMERCGMATGTRRVAQKLWGDRLPARNPALLVRELYDAENAGNAEPSGAQDMVGLIYPGICRLDFRRDHAGGYFPSHVEQCVDREVIAWAASNLWILPVAPRPAGYNPLGEKNIRPDVVARLGRSGAACFDALLARDVARLGASMNECSACWGELLPHTLTHPTLELDLCSLLSAYQASYPGAMFSGCGGGYLYVASPGPVHGGFRPDIRID